MAIAQKMARAKELNADIVIHLHISPKANREFAEGFTSPIFADYGRTFIDAWKSIAPRDRFFSIDSESLLTAIEQVSPHDKEEWADWLLRRYGWWRE